MSQQVTPFVFEGEHAIRHVEINGEPWFVGRDVAAALEHRDAQTALRGLDQDEKGTHIVRTPGGDQEMTVISEAGVYQLIFTSRKPAAKRFKRWLAHEVIPAIRKTGTYSSGAQPAAFGVRVRTRIRELNMTVVGVERAGGWTIGYLTDLINGRKKSVDYDNLVKLARILQTTDAWLLHGDVADQLSPAKDAPLFDHDFREWTLEEARVKKSIADLYKFVYGADAAKWIVPQLGFPTPPDALIEAGSGRLQTKASRRK